MDGHLITLSFDDAGFVPVAVLHCTLEPGAQCRRWCGGEDPACWRGACHHPPTGECVAVHVAQRSVGMEAWLMGKSTSVTLPIEVDWQGTYPEPVWRFADDAGVPDPALPEAPCGAVHPETASLPIYAGRDLRCKAPRNHLGPHLPFFVWAPAWSGETHADS